VDFTLLPAVDIVDGKAVQLVQGVAGSGKEYGDPLTAALNWQADGAQWLHLVDLDAAFGRGNNRELITELVGKLDIAVELTGGIRDDASLAAALSTGCARVNVGTAAVENPAWCAKAIAEHGEKIAIALDVKISAAGHRLAARGWVSDGGDLWEALDRLDRDGCARYVITDVGKDGMLQGPNVALLRDICERTDAALIASGGVSTVDDLLALAALAPDGVEGAIVGTALYQGAFTLPEALAALG
jgi:1-(5-phosphoribosyl)-5-[(5-phosphoribosylamino)methylideneamino] imidazole-4-carboxamide isomerase/N-(5'phosphoribosyl)anthranilate isomerase